MTSERPKSAVSQIFSKYSEQYDELNDRRERIVKMSRDITIASKRAIFFLHRANAEEIACAKQKFDKIHEILAKIAIEIKDQDYWRYQRAFSPGLQEYIEAMSFFYYLTRKELVPREFIAQEISAVAGIPFYVNESDYVLGVCDLTGELMRMAISSAANADQEKSQEISRFLQTLYNEFSMLDMHERDYKQKMRVMGQSVQKVENVCFAAKLRFSEFPDQDVPFDVDNIQ